MAKDYDLFFVCSLVECIGRMQKIRRSEVVKSLGVETIQHIYDYADVLHCESIEDVAETYVKLKQIPSGNYDNIAICEYEIPSVWTMGDVYTRLITNVH